MVNGNAWRMVEKSERSCDNCQAILVSKLRLRLLFHRDVRKVGSVGNTASIQLEYWWCGCYRHRWFGYLFHSMNPPPPCFRSPNTVSSFEFAKCGLISVLFHVFACQGTGGLLEDERNKNESNGCQERMQYRSKTMCQISSPPKHALSKIVGMGAPLPNADITPRMPILLLESAFLQIGDTFQK